MKPSYVLLISFLGAASTVALADDGADRSRQFLAEFRQQQQQVHGEQSVAEAAPADALKQSI
ncbi:MULTISPECIES: hypothetical protein [unclassified Pseudomonas]|uniref:hypothetical protein n=1 Tax=unclassified Pseudomonas TaxID=196821 RepID=UPI0015A169D1|nr:MULTISPECIES: hypothetical protein [unclassified Pseudomonas]NWC93785.1 hypothetical protein [Pseudomonas sp. IPO3779]NWD16241.1 hypothetical protein [Pseudomonas sp. IPO3778]